SVRKPRGTATSRAPRARPGRAPRNRRRWAARSTPRAGGRSASWTPYDPQQQRGEPEYHRECVVIEVPGLRVAHHRAQPPDDPGAAVDQSAVDHGLISSSPQTAAQAPGAGGDDVLVEPIEAVLVDEDRVQPLEPALRRTRPRRILVEEQPRGENAARGEIQRQRGNCRPEECARVVEFLSSVLQ